MNNNFFKLNNKFNMYNEIISTIKSSSNSDWIHTHGFDILKINIDLIKQNKVLWSLHNVFPSYLLILKMKPNTFYRLHVDEKRSAAINVLLEGNNSLSFYGEQTQDEEVSNIEVVNYEYNSMYLFDTTNKHGVINLNNDRLMFSMSFNKPLKYSTIKNFCAENNF